MDLAFARRVEDASLRAWPPLESEWIDGWELRSAAGFSKRANSVQPFGPSTHSLSEKVQECEAWYATRDLPVIFRLTPFSDSGLDALLEQRGYELVEPTDVLAMRLPAASSDAADASVVELDLQEWVEKYLTMSGRPSSTAPILRAILEACGRERFLVGVSPRRATDQVACGLAVRDDEFVGLFDLVTAERHRRRGYGAALVAGLLEWGLARGARHAYLQVVRTNVPARGLYRKLGFTSAYAYWYRVRPT